MEIILTIAAVVIPSLVLVYIGVVAHNQAAKAKGTSEKGYSGWSVLLGFLTLCAYIFYELFLKIRGRG